MAIFCDSNRTKAVYMIKFTGISPNCHIEKGLGMIYNKLNNFL
jgi:hypothetical protein